jgi:hypothetical protein
MTDERKDAKDAKDANAANDFMDALIRAGAAEYNRPNATPRDEIWKRIQARRAAGATSATRRPTSFRLYGSIGLAAAATLLIGIVIGGRLERTNQRVTAMNGFPIEDLVTSTGEYSDTNTAAAAYRRVMVEHIGNSEAMITSFRANARSGTVDKQMADWSGGLLVRTRMLESSPASNDPVMKRLLEDLDLVLAQITQYSGQPTHRPDDLDLIEQSIDQRGVMTKLRATIPASTTTPPIRGS